VARKAIENGVFNEAKNSPRGEMFARKESEISEMIIKNERMPIRIETTL
jgi:hypothetical protein